MESAGALDFWKAGRVKPAVSPTHYLNIGEIIISPEPIVISTVLGSCVSVCLHAPISKMGGMNHYAHPKLQSNYGQDEDYRYGDVAIRALVDAMEEATGEPRATFTAKVVGGATEIAAENSGLGMGKENVQQAFTTLRALGIKVIGEDVGGTQGRKALFHTATQRLQVAKIVPSTEEIKPPILGVRPTLVKTDAPVPRPASTPTSAPMPTRRRRVMIVDDSKTIRDLLKRILSEDPELEVCAMAASAEEATEMLLQSRPDVVTLDVNMPGQSGVEWLEATLPRHAIPAVMISSLQLREGNEVFRALELGAVDYIQKPTLAELPIVSPVIREKVKAASSAKVFQRRKSAIVREKAGDVDFRTILAIGASTGGTEALKDLMCGMPDEIPPTVIVQHIPPVFSKAFADRLNQLCPFEVKEAEDGDELRPSRVLIAPGGRQMKLQATRTGYCVRITDDPPMNRHKPSVDYLFHSVAELIGKNCVGVILTGMGADGAKGLLKLRQLGARTLAQDEASSVVYGMPKAAFEMGAVEKVAPLDEMAHEVLLALRRRKAA